MTAHDNRRPSRRSPCLEARRPVPAAPVPLSRCSPLSPSRPLGRGQDHPHRDHDGRDPDLRRHCFDSVGPYERLVGKAHGEVDPAHPLNAIIQDIALAPRNARGMVEYSTDIHILKPVDLARGNGVLFFNVVNRGNKGGLSSYNAGISGTTATINQAADAGDGFMMRHGFSLVWFGWQADVLAGDNRLTTIART